MKWKSIELALRAQHRTIEREASKRGHHTDEDRAYARRIPKLVKKIQRHSKVIGRIRKGNTPFIPIAVDAAPQYQQLRSAVERNARIVCFDAEWQYQYPNHITELGVAILHNGVMEVHNVRVKPGGKTFHGGTTKYMSDAQGKAWLREIMNSADLLVGHALKNDRMKLKEWQCPLPEKTDLPVVDTASWSRVTNPDNNPRKLSALAALFDIECRGTHVAGNDAMITLNVALAMAGLGEAR